MNNKKPSTHVQPWPIGMFIALWLVGWTLRVPILAAPPLATRIADTFGLGEAGIGALTMLPIVAIAFGAIPAAWIISRLGIRNAIVVGMLVMVAASVARGYVPTATTLFTISVVMGLGVAIFQTALPAATRLWTPAHIGLGSAVFLNGMMFGELSGAGLTLPIILPLAGGDWRFALILWAIPILLITVLIALGRFPTQHSDVVQTTAAALTTQKTLPSWNDKQVWQYGLLLAGSIVTFIAINAFAGTLLRARQELYALEGLLFVFNAMPLLASFTVLAAPKWIGQRNPIAISAALAALGLAGFTFLDGWASWLAAILAGYASTVELVLLLSLPAILAKGMAVTRLSAGTTLIGYGVAFVLPLIGGALADRLNSTELVLIPSLIFTIAVLASLGRSRQYTEYK